VGVSVQHRGFFGTLAGLLRAYNGRDAHVISGEPDHPLVCQVHWNAGTDYYTALNVPSALTAIGASFYTVSIMDLGDFTEARLFTRSSGAGLTTVKLLAKYVTTFTTTAASWLQLGTSSVEVTLPSAVGNVDSGWIPLASGAQADNVYLHLFTSGGDGAADPSIGRVSLLFRR